MLLLHQFHECLKAPSMQILLAIINSFGDTIFSVRQERHSHLGSIVLSLWNQQGQTGIFIESSVSSIGDAAAHSPIYQMTKTGFSRSQLQGLDTLLTTNITVLGI
jgi:hypothetical protein